MREINDVLKKMNQSIEKAIEQGVFPGANYGVLYKGEIHVGSLGNRALIPEMEKNTLDTIYDLASLTKPLATTLAVMKLMDMDILSMDTPVSEYLPYVQYQDVTIKDLLIHSSGYPALTPGTEEMRTVEPLIYDLENCTREYEPGSKVVYSDVGFMYLGFIVEKLTGSMDEFLKEHFYGPLGLSDTTFNHGDTARIAPTEEFKFRGLIRGEVHDEKGFLLGGIAGHAGLYSTIDDLMILSQMLLSGGVYNGEKYLSDQALELMKIPVIKVDHEDYRTHGWIERTRHGHIYICHTGFTGTSILLDFEHKLGFVLLTNRVHPTRENKKIIPYRKDIESIVFELVNGDSYDNK